MISAVYYVLTLINACTSLILEAIPVVGRPSDAYHSVCGKELHIMQVPDGAGFSGN
jgi:hypothetical protein